jgi:cathepsin F
MSNTTLLVATLGALIFTGAFYYANNTSDLEIPQHVVNSFTAFKVVHNKVYASQAEHNFRLAVFHAHYIAAQEHNDKNLGSTYGITKFSDLTKEEFKKQFKGYIPPTPGALKAHKKSYANRNLTTESIDWRGTGAVSPVKDQGQCGSCWAFSATEAIETGYWMNTKEQKILAPQQITSCDEVD